MASLSSSGWQRKGNNLENKRKRGEIKNKSWDFAPQLGRPIKLLNESCSSQLPNISPKIIKLIKYKNPLEFWIQQTQTWKSQHIWYCFLSHFPLSNSSSKDHFHGDARSFETNILYFLLIGNFFKRRENLKYLFSLKSVKIFVNIHYTYILSYIF